MQARRRDHDAAVGQHVDARSKDLAAGVLADREERVLKDQMPTAAAGERSDSVRQWPELLFQTRERLLALISRVDVEDENACLAARGNPDVCVRSFLPPGAYLIAIHAGVVDAVLRHGMLAGPVAGAAFRASAATVLNPMHWQDAVAARCV